ncbi:TonB-dependent siderophore receptor [Methylotenera versatilis]|uniref:TonB-dependent siderophore receptor n=1 Tax=Methylotenera versatilis TaxID=1055487 RepID=UPI0006455EFB|nr:TonB-dependent siderophore receptor [Methylotenera versatilis]
MQDFQCHKVARYKIIVAAIIAAAPYFAMAEDTLPEVTVKANNVESEQPSEKTNSYTVKSTATATRLNTTLRETPQSISVITRQELDDFRILSVNDALSYATGIKVEQFETDRTEYTARGLNITSFQIDGLNSPISFSGTNYGDLDVAVFDRIEVLRGANGLVAGTGNPSATINFVRKRATKDFQAKVDVSAGSWDNRRLDADVSSALNADGSVRGRLVGAYQDRNSYLDRYSTERNVVYGVIEADLSDSTSVAIGHTYQKNDSSGNNFGSLPLLYTDGTKRHYKVSDSVATDWAYMKVDTNVSFAELTHYFNNDWKVKGQLTYKDTGSEGRYNYIDGFEDRATGLGSYTSYPYIYSFATKDHVADIYANGPFELGGRKHELVVGATWSKSYMKEFSRIGDTLGNISVVSFDDLGNFPMPNFGPKSKDSDYQSTTTNIYTAAKLNPTDALKVTVGGSLLSYKLEGVAYGADQAAKENNKFTPYVGTVLDLNDTISLYASYAGIYKPQVEKGVNLKPLAPLKGKNYEAGIKSEWFNKKLNSSFALFRTEQENQAQAVGENGTITTYEGIQATTKGYEFDVSGEVTDHLNINAGYTRLMSVKGDHDQNVNPFVPRHLVHLTTVYTVPSIENLKVGASLNWQSDTHVDIQLETLADPVRYKQGSYATLNLMANYKIDEHWSAAVNLYNVTDEKYLSTMQYAYAGQAFYAPPFSGLATLTWKY